jgi:Family of unknown function (DUF6644)
LLGFIQWLNGTSWSLYLRESELAFPLTEAIHLIGLGVSVGTIMWVDLRLLGLTMTRERVSDVVNRLERWAIAGFIVMFTSGFVLFLGKPETYYTTTAFRIKMMLLPLAALNVWFFHKGVYPHVTEWDRGVRVPWQGRLVGFASMALWLAIIVAGRWTAYFADPLYTAGIKR